MYDGYRIKCLIFHTLQKYLPLYYLLGNHPWRTKTLILNQVEFAEKLNLSRILLMVEVVGIYIYVYIYIYILGVKNS